MITVNDDIIVVVAVAIIIFLIITSTIIGSPSLFPFRSDQNPGPNPVPLDDPEPSVPLFRFLLH